MMTIEELHRIKAEREKLVLVRRAGKKKIERLAEDTGYRKQILVCGGTGCHSSGSKKVIAALEKAIKEKKLEKEVLIVKTGCFGLCALGPIMIVYPEGSFYSQVTTEGVEEIVEQHIKNGNVVTHLLYQETVDPSGKVKSLNETDFYKKQLRVALRNCGVIDPENIEEYIATGGYEALAKVVTSM
ncbi:MAG: NAD(P)H-dependent oxidoreductase subunit E, partial [Lachnospiraceae bacterium]